jgi:hypothetical protein
VTLRSAFTFLMALLVVACGRGSGFSSEPGRVRARLSRVPPMLSNQPLAKARAMLGEHAIRVVLADEALVTLGGGEIWVSELRSTEFEDGYAVQVSLRDVRTSRRTVWTGVVEPHGFGWRHRRLAQSGSSPR